MNSSKQHHDSVADEQAALWAARLDGDSLDRAQRAELDTWLAENSAHRALLSHYCQFSADLEEQIPALVSAGALSIPSPAKGGPRPLKWNFPRLPGIAFAAAAAIAVTVSIIRPAPEVQFVAMASAQRGPSTTLADGTRVELNANTSLRFENTKDGRLVRLAGGEALFSVAKDPARPFIVRTPAGSVRVTGTTFNVRTDPSRTAFEVTVVEGSVEVLPDSGKKPALVPLVAGDQFSSAAGTARRLSAGELEDALAWRTGIIVFKGTPLSEAAA